MTYHYSGGLAEIVSEPSKITYSFLKKWITGRASLGIAMKHLGLPYKSISEPILKLVDGELIIDLKAEERTLYSNTCFSYSANKSINNKPNLAFKYNKILNINNLLNTLSILFKQSQWIASPTKAINKAINLYESIPISVKNDDLKIIDKTLQINVWPNVIAVGYLSEFYNQLIEKENKKNIAEVMKYISHNIGKKDWFINSVNDMYKVKKNRMTLTSYINKYGLRADDDYELTCPRWYEITDIVKKRIKDTILPEQYENIAKNTTDIMSANKNIQASIELQVLRSKSKKKALFFIDKLRQVLIKKHKIKKYPLYKTPRIKKNRGRNKAAKKPSKGIGIGVSQGIATGNIQKVTSSNTPIKLNAIVVFPNASPKFSIQYSKCKGMIFLKGGTTSHGAIVAREFGIPALIYPNASEISADTNITINGSTGEWSLR